MSPPKLCPLLGSENIPNVQSLIDARLHHVRADRGHAIDLPVDRSFVRIVGPHELAELELGLLEVRPRIDHVLLVRFADLRDLVLLGLAQVELAQTAVVATVMPMGAFGTLHAPMVIAATVFALRKRGGLERGKRAYQKGGKNKCPLHESLLRHPAR